MTHRAVAGALLAAVLCALTVPAAHAQAGALVQEPPIPQHYVASGASEADQAAAAHGAAADAAANAEFDFFDDDGDSKLSRGEFRNYYRISGKGAALLAKQGEAPVVADPRAPGQINAVRAVVEKEALAFWSSALRSVAMIIVTELGDKTFFIAAIMAMRHARMAVYIGAMGALGLMTILSAGIGYALPSLLPKKYTHYAATVLFVFFGYKLLHEAYEMSCAPPGGVNEELEEAEKELAEVDGKKADDIEGGEPPAGAKTFGNKTLLQRKLELWAPVIWQAFTLTFVAEWGDRSQIATIALASSKDPYGVTLGGTIGHGLCTGLAVIGGKLLAAKISERTVALAGGVLFWIFALHELWVGP